MLLESFGGNNETQQLKEGIEQQKIPSFNDSELNIREQYTKNQGREGSRELAMQQLNENKNLKNDLESDTLKETHELLDKEALINEAKTQIYEYCGISENLGNNSVFENFSKGFIDELLIGNYDMAIEIINTKGEIIIDALKQLATWEGLKKIAKSLGESIWDLFSGNAYERGKSVAELGLVTTGIGIGASLGKKGLKLGMKQISKLRVNKETIVKSVDVKDVVGKTKGEIERIVPSRQFDFESILIEDIAKLGDLDRVEVGSFYLKRELPSIQEKAIIDAHNVGKNRSGAGINNYNQDEIMQKTRILQEAGFTKEERRILLEKGVCGKEFVGLYNNPDYRFLQGEEYSNVREFLGDIDINDVIGEGVNAIIVNHPVDPTKIVKIGRPKKDNIIKEVESHNRCVDALNELKDNPKYNIDDNIKIPEINLGATDNFYTMDKIQGHSFKTKFYIEKYGESLNGLGYTKEKLHVLSDNQVEQILRKNRYQALQKPSEPTYIQTPREKNLEIEYLEWWDKKYKSEDLVEARRVLDLLKSEKGIDVQDRNPGNFMQTTDGKTYLIDFGLIK